VTQPVEYMSVGERIAIYRRRRGLSQLALANMIGRSEAWLRVCASRAEWIGLAAERSGRWKQAELAGIGDRLSAAGDAELAVDRLDMAPHGVG
jgi:hypothetical protein